MGDRQARHQSHADIDDDRRIVERRGALALAVGLVAMISAALAYGEIPFILGMAIPPATWALFACIPWNGAGNPLRWRQFGFLAVINALAMIFLVPVLGILGPGAVLALSGVVLAARIRSPYLGLAGAAFAAVVATFPWTFWQQSAPLAPYAILLVALVGLWRFLTYAQSQRPLSPRAVVEHAEV